jgi:tRNA pseudouridine65 synthase
MPDVAFGLGPALLGRAPPKPDPVHHCLRRRAAPTARNLGPPASQPVRIVRAGDGWVAIDKPANLLVHRNEKIAAGETAFVVSELRRLLTDVAAPDVRVVHRLDRPTSGVMLFAVGDSAAAARLQASLQDSSVTRKEYWALARCAPGALPDAADWVNDSPLRNAAKSRDAEPQAARTNFTRLLRLAAEVQRLDAGGDAADAEFEPHEIAVLRAELATGRRHQIRRHLANAKCPIVEDTSYSKGRWNRDARARYGAARLALHSRRLTFRDPSPAADGAIVTVDAPVPEDLRAVLARVPGFDSGLHGGVCDLGVPAEDAAATLFSA